MPDCYQVNSPRKVSQKKFTRKDFGLPKNKFVFVSFNSPIKINSQTFDAWMKILRKSPNSILWLFAQNESVIKNLRSEANKLKVNPRRIIFAKKLAMDEHLKRHELANLALDTIGYSGGATTSHALWMGLPVITLPGKTYISRMSASLVNATGLVELIAGSEEEYINKAVELASDPSKLSKIRERLKDNVDKGYLFDTKRFVKNLENAYRMIWERYLEGKKPKNVYLR
jgi:predicted O-linked N-acetylglucosamine transferase (SPINDLY family)